jgi:CDP-glycerol glycerophosphotransferase (TagB/SpsB family)
MSKPDARHRLGLDKSRLTVIYAPSFEYCSSLATDGRKIIDTLMALGINLIVKPHPAFYNASAFNDDFNRDIPTADMWREWIESRTDGHTCIFPLENTLDPVLAIAASDLMVTDYSGVAFDGILQDLGMVFWDCPTLFDEYLPRRYGIDGRKAQSELACNVGRDAGIVVRDEYELVTALETYRKNARHLSREREEIRRCLLFNPGRATMVMASEIEKLLSTEAK